MTVYLICDVSISDPVRYEQYLHQALPTLQRYGAKLVALQDGPEPIEGGWAPQRTAVVEFEDAATAKEWYHSAAYQEAKKLRDGAVVAKIVLAEGPDASRATRRLAERYFADILGRGDLALVDELMTESFRFRPPPSVAPEPLIGREAFKQVVAGLRVPFPDLRFEVHDVVADGDRAMASWTMRGTQRGEWLGVPATGREVTLIGVDVFHVVDGRIDEVQIHGDYLGGLRQLGAIKEPSADAVRSDTQLVGTPT
jgi:steroid delta-isomerase-like uncharacterized protein